MKFVHIADVHFDAPFTVLETRGFAQSRRLDQRNSFKKVIDYIKENNIEYFFISGDLYEEGYVRNSTIQFIKNEFQRIPKTKVFIVPRKPRPIFKKFILCYF